MLDISAPKVTAFSLHVQPPHEFIAAAYGNFNRAIVFHGHKSSAATLVFLNFIHVDNMGIMDPAKGLGQKIFIFQSSLKQLPEDVFPPAAAWMHHHRSA